MRQRIIVPENSSLPPPRHPAPSWIIALEDFCLRANHFSEVRDMSLSWLQRQKEMKGTFFFVYDSNSKKFTEYSTDKSVTHVHKNILIAGNNVYFSSCKTPFPVGRLDLTNGKFRMFGKPAPQGAVFYLKESNVFIKGLDGKIYRVDESQLTRSKTKLSTKNIVEMSFEDIFKNGK